MNTPNNFKLNIRNAENQYDTGACVACCVAAILKFISNEEYSTLWLYGYRPDYYGHAVGSDVVSILKTVVEEGVLTKSQCDDLCEIPEAETIIMSNIDEYLKLANKNKPIASYGRLYTLDEIKNNLYENKLPIILSIGIYNNSIDLENNIAKIPSMANNWHTVIVYGWDETGLLAQNTWGQNWGDNGCFIVPYDYPISEAWYVIKKED